MTTSNTKKTFSLSLLLVAVVLVASGIYGLSLAQRKAEPPAGSTALATGFNRTLAKGPVAAFLVHAARKPVPDFAFTNKAGEALSLDRWKGRVVLVNLWATWCTPCKKEMPDLAALQKAVGGPDFEVVAISVDRKGLEASATFLKDVGADSLELYSEPEARSLAAFQALGLPASILIDRQGLEAGRLLGPAEWASPEAQALIAALVSERK